MTGTDPAVEAADRWWLSRGDTEQAREDSIDCLSDVAHGAARAALAPIRELHLPINQYLPCEASEIHAEAFEDADGEWCCPVCTRRDGGPRKMCAECRDEDGDRVDWPCDTARFIYTSEELTGRA